jgi:uncharacterized iron-regulated membrane protein
LHRVCGEQPFHIGFSEAHLMRKVVNKLHLWIGLASGAVIMTVAITGCLYCFEEEFRNFLHNDLVYTKPQAIPKPLTELIAAVKKKYQAKVRSIRLFSENARTAEIILRDKTSVFVDPYTARILGAYNRDKDFFGVVLTIHRSLCMGDTGKIITGISTILFLFMLISGMVLWWPVKKGFGLFQFVIQLRAPRYKVFYDLHRVLGFYSSWIIIFTVITGLTWSFKWMEKGMYWISRSKKEEATSIHSSVKEQRSPHVLNNAYYISQNLYPGARQTFISLPDDSLGAIRIIQRFESDGFFRRTNQFFFDQYNGTLLKSQLYERSSTGDKFKATNYDIHTGKVLGIAGQFIVFCAALTAASLPVTGIILWRKKRSKRPGIKSA